MDDVQDMSQECEGSADRPLVTFALFAYNQERYIREAVEGAFSQTYEPLEIILSDDCSTDRTFEIMQEMAAEYKGPHLVTVRKKTNNLGLVDHVRAVVLISQGKIIVMAAGDDVSKAHRVEKIVEVWEGRPVGIFSGYDLIDSAGNYISINQQPNHKSYEMLPWLRDFSTEDFVYGATSAYDASIIRMLPSAGKKVMSEDTPLNLIINLGKFNTKRIEDSLVNYRLHEKTLSNSTILHADINEIINSEILRPFQIIRERDILYYIINNIIPIFKNSREIIDINCIYRNISVLDMKITWYRYGIIDRLLLIIRSRNSEKKWLILRLFGSRGYAYAKFISLWISGVRKKEWGK